MTPVQLQPGDLCKYEGCRLPAAAVACGRTDHPSPAVYCQEHAEKVAREERPEYHVDCPNCGCRFGIG